LTLKFKVDENLPVEVALLLSAAGHDAVTVPDQRMGGRPDRALAEVSRQEGRAVVTLDLGFSDIRAYPPPDYPGLLVLRLSRIDKVRVLHAVQRLLPMFGQEPLARKLWIVEDATVRIRG
jgi:predicted nuclease of predicted toxin-antitoxin system